MSFCLTRKSPLHHDDDQCSTLNFTTIHDTLKHLLSPPSDCPSPHLKFTHGDSPEKPSNLPQFSLLNKHTSLCELNAALLIDDGRNHLQSALHSVKTFEELKLDKNLLEGIYQMGFCRPSRIQERALPQLLAYPPRNMIAQSQNGTGKTVRSSSPPGLRLDSPIA